MSSSKFFRNAYPSGKKSLIHQLRDGESFIHFMPLFIEKGFEYGGLLLNFDLIYLMITGAAKRLSTGMSKKP